MSEIDWDALPPGVRREVEALRAKIERQRAALRQWQEGDESAKRQVPFLSARLQEARAESARLAAALEAAEGRIASALGVCAESDSVPGEWKTTPTAGEVVERVRAALSGTGEPS